MKIIHPRPNPIVAALYTLRDMNVDVVVIHGPSGCGFMASRALEQAGVRIVTTALSDSNLIFGGSDELIKTLKKAYEMFNPKTIAVVGTCASMIIGEDMGSSIKRAGLDCIIFPVEVHGCMGSNTEGAIKALEAGRDAGLLQSDETDRQINLMNAAMEMEKERGLASRSYMKPSSGVTKLTVCKMIRDTLSNEGKVAVVMNAKKELAYRFSDMFIAMEEARKTLGGSTFYVANLNTEIGLPKIREYARNVVEELEQNGIVMDAVVGGLDEYALVGDRMRSEVEMFGPDITIILGICHAYPGIEKDDILITDQPRQLSNYINLGFPNSVGEISSHSMVMGTDTIIPLETADTLRELVREN